MKIEQQIRADYAKGQVYRKQLADISVSALADFYGVSRETITNVGSYRTWNAENGKGKLSLADVIIIRRLLEQRHKLRREASQYTIRALCKKYKRSSKTICEVIHGRTKAKSSHHQSA